MSQLVPTIDSNVRLKARKSGRYAVVLLHGPPDWKAGSHRSLPPSIESARFLIRGCRAAEASTVAQAFNREHFGGDVAVVVSTMFGLLPENEPQPCRCGE
jgi:hypothetical protein